MDIPAFLAPGLFIFAVKFLYEELSKLPSPPAPDATTTPLYDRHYIPPDFFDAPDRSGAKSGNRAGSANEGPRTTTTRRTTRYYPWVSRLPPAPPNPPKLTRRTRRTRRTTTSLSSTVKVRWANVEGVGIFVYLLFWLTRKLVQLPSPPTTDAPMLFDRHIPPSTKDPYDRG